MNRSTRTRSRCISGIAAAVMAVGGLLASSPAASASPNPVGGPGPYFELETNGVFQEYGLNVANLTQNSVDVTRGPNRSQQIDNLAGCGTRAHVLNLLSLDYQGDVVLSINMYDACIVRVTNGEVYTIAFSHFTTSRQPATS
ncbi:hypothetical protein [Kitasatospora kifunensis]|uniref:Uncharacterized protein n=1 Tax=Kitasatospora kifunensis TaxID=58351 RepID=A0A7W7VTU9_KITKI|nr:hypothetical protein [Kitasatospora kifunensis]MBB4922632.1 hypothetical protein [Kitasatospora kifunensis]